MVEEGQAHDLSTPSPPPDFNSGDGTASANVHTWVATWKPPALSPPAGSIVPPAQRWQRSHRGAVGKGALLSALDSLTRALPSVLLYGTLEVELFHHPRHQQSQVLQVGSCCQPGVGGSSGYQPPARKPGLAPRLRPQRCPLCREPGEGFGSAWLAF